MPVYIDQLFREVNIPTMPQRIVSLVPSQTELLAALGLDDEVVGITKFCIHPEQWFRSKARIGGTKTVSIEKLAALQPDLVIANKEENVMEQVHAIQSIAPVWVSDVNTIEDALQMINSIGAITGKAREATTLAAEIEKGITALKAYMHNQRAVRTAYLIWKDPYMAAGGDTFINDVMTLGGFENVLQHQKRYPVITPQEMASMDTECILLSSEPYPFRQKHINELQEQLPRTKIILVDGEVFSWYGSRMTQIHPYLRSLRENDNRHEES